MYFYILWLFVICSGSKCQKKAWHDHHQEECIFLKKISESNLYEDKNLFDFIRIMFRLVFKLKKDGEDEVGVVPNGQNRKFSDLMSHQEKLAEDETATDLVTLFYDVIKSCIPIKRWL